MPDKSPVSSVPSAKPHEPGLASGASPGGITPRPTATRSPDTATELAERAQLIGEEAGTKVASAMRDVIGAAAGLAGFAVESVRDLVQYLVRRGQMTQDEADRLIREAEETRGKRAPKTVKSEVRSVKAEPKSAVAPSQPREAPAVRGAAKTSKKAPAANSSAAASEKKPTARKS